MTRAPCCSRSSTPFRCALFWKDRESRYLGCNTLFAEDGGKHTPLELLGKDDFSLAWKDQAALYRADDKAVMVSGIPRIGFEEPQTAPDGHEIWLRTSKVPLRNTTNEVIGILGIYDDITELKTKTEDLRQIEDRYHQLFDTIPVPLCVIDNETMSFLSINDAALRQYGYTREESQGKTLKAIFFEEDFSRLEKFLATRMRHLERVVNTLVRHRRKDGSAIWLEVSSHSLIFEGRPARIFQGYDVTRSKHAEEDLRLTKAAIDRSKIAFFRLAPDGVVQYVNESACQSLGYTREELIGKQPWDFDPDFPSDAWPSLWKELKHNKIVHIESRHRRQDGTMFPVQITGNYIRMGKTEYSFTFAQDITERKAAEAQLRQAEERYRILFDNSPVPTCVLDLENMQFLDINDAGLEQYGYTRQDAKEKSPLDLLFPEDIPRYIEHIAEELKHPGRITHGIWRHRKKDGTPMWMETSAHNIDYAGRPARIVQGHDITRRLQAEEELRNTEAHYRLMFEANPVALGIYDPKTLTFMAVNDAAVEQYGYSREEFLQMTVQQIFLPEDLLRLKKHIEEEILQKTRANSSSWKQRRKDGGIFWVQLTGHALEYMGRPARMVLAQDITEIKRSELRERARSEVMEQLAKGAPLHQVLTTIVLSVEQENPSMLCSILLLDDTGERLLTGAAPSLPDFYNAAINGLKIGSGVGSCGMTIFTGERVIVEDIQTHPYWVPYRELAARAELGACWSNPIVSANGKVIGSFAIYHHNKCTPTAADIELIEHSSFLAGVAIERSLASAAMQLASLVYQNSSEGMVVTDAENRIIAINPAFTRLTGYALEEVLGRDPSVLSSHHQDQAFYQTIWASLDTTGQWQGEIWNKRKNGEEFAEWLTINTIYGDDGKMHRRVALFSDITEKKRTDALIWNQANYDTLTQLPNRRLFRDRLEFELKKAHRETSILGLLFIDLDHFKEVNDSLGHHMGDELLIQAALRIQHCIRDSDSVARLGGDEFTVILSGLNDIADIGRVAQNIIDALDKPFQLGEEQAYISASIGITVYPDDASNVGDLLKNADQAMYEAKRAGRNRYSYFTASMQKAAITRMRLVSDIHQAMAANQFSVYFQPIVELATGSIHKAEALLRWQHPQQGFISPEVFIPIAEDTGLIHDIGNWVFEESVRQVRHWRNRYDPNFQISINKSPVQFRAESHVHENWVNRLQQQGLSGSSIVIEITEGLLLNADTSINSKLLMFRDAGVQVAIDDFGTGYSSLSYLKKFDIDYLKIDQSFIRNLGADDSDLALSEAIIVMAHKLGLKVIAEGVETEQQRDILQRIGCDYAQGYLYSTAVPHDQFEAFLDARLQPR